MSALLIGSALGAQRSVAADSREKPSGVRAQGALERSVTVTLDRVSVRTAVNKLTANARVRVWYETELLDAIRGTVTLRATAMPLGEALERVLAGTGLQASVVSGEALTIKPSGAAQWAGSIITGTVRDAATKRPLRGANVTLDKQTRGVQTDENGQFRLAAVQAGAHSVDVRLIGYARRSQSVTVEEKGTVTVEFLLAQSAKTLDQVVVTGTVIPTELRAIPNAITVITAKQLEERGITRIDQLFHGDVPGLHSQNRGTYAGGLGAVLMTSRGASAFGGSQSAGTDGWPTNPIKTYVDGVEIADPKYLSQIDPKNIERIEILAGPQASTIYGSNAINGVMQVFTKRGATSRPQLTLHLISGVIQNNQGTALAPQHDYSAQVSGTDRTISYNAGAGWNYTAPWNPTQQSTRRNAYGGVRMELSTPAGIVRGDVSLQRTFTVNHSRGESASIGTELQARGTYAHAFDPTQGAAPVYFDYSSQTLGTTVNYSPLSWWSHEFGMGNDYSENTYRSTARRYLMPYDTNAFLIVSRADRRSLRYNTTLGVPLGNLAAATLTMGGDGWQSLTSSGAGYSTVLTGALTGYTSRDPTHNTGAFLQSQVTLLDRLFLTYGFRAEWNPAYGDEAIPNYVPRYGVAYTQEFSGVTAKLRASYGSSTRPPTRKAKLGTIIYRSYIPYFGANWDLLPNPQLGPEFQRGGEGGIELYFGGRGSLVVTRYNQTVERLITNVERVDSVQSFTTDPYGYCAPYGEYCGYDYWPQSQNINLGNIRNQGWELQGTTTNGPFTTRGTYSWTKSRVLGLDPQYALKFPAASYPSYQPGATFQHVAEHTWALGVTYARAGTTVALTANGTGEMVGYGNQLSLLHTSSAMRLMNDRWRVAPSVYETAKPAYMLADLMASHRITAGVEGLLQISNLADRYESDAGSSYAVIGRQTKVGLRMRF